jgi:hypothetical protein
MRLVVAGNIMETNEFTGPPGGKTPPKGRTRSAEGAPNSEHRLCDFEFERDGSKRQSRFRISFRALVALLLFILILATMFGGDWLASVLKRLP